MVRREWFSETYLVARKAHMCISCRMSVPVGLKHRHERSIYGGDFHQCWHLECNDAFKAETAASGECKLEFCPGENVRFNHSHHLRIYLVGIVLTVSYQ